jgi:hypothetical protein
MGAMMGWAGGRIKQVTALAQCQALGLLCIKPFSPVWAWG